MNFAKRKTGDFCSPLFGRTRTPGGIKEAAENKKSSERIHFIHICLGNYHCKKLLRITRAVI